MEKQTLLKIVNPLLALSLLVQALSGYFREELHELLELHEANAVILLLLAASHLALNWSWVRSHLPFPHRTPEGN